MICFFSVYKICENEKNPLRCWVGDLQHKHTNLNVAGKIIDLPSTKKFFTDSNLPLTGQASIVGHSIVLHDDNAPKHRGKRMACTAIRRQYRHKGCLTPVHNLITESYAKHAEKHGDLSFIISLFHEIPLQVKFFIRSQ